MPSCSHEEKKPGTAHPSVKQQIVDMTLNGGGVRDIVRVLKVSSATAIDLLDIQLHDRVLEVRFSPGVGIQLLAWPASAGYVAGVDDSDCHSKTILSTKPWRLTPL